jgi:hypothetical protein
MKKVKEVCISWLGWAGGRGRVDEGEPLASPVWHRRWAEFYSTGIEKVEADIEKHLGTGSRESINADGSPGNSVTGAGFWNRETACDRQAMPLIQKRQQLLADYQAMGGDSALDRARKQTFTLRDQIARRTIYSPEGDFVERFIDQNGRRPSKQEFETWRASQPTR